MCLIICTNGLLYKVLAERGRQEEVAVDAAPHLSGVAAVRPGKEEDEI